MMEWITVISRHLITSALLEYVFLKRFMSFPDENECGLNNTQFTFLIHASNSFGFVDVAIFEITSTCKNDILKT